MPQVNCPAPIMLRCKSKGPKNRFSGPPNLFLPALYGQRTSTTGSLASRVFHVLSGA